MKNSLVAIVKHTLLCVKTKPYEMKSIIILIWVLLAIEIQIENQITMEKFLSHPCTTNERIQHMIMIS